MRKAFCMLIIPEQEDFDNREAVPALTGKLTEGKIKIVNLYFINYTT